MTGFDTESVARVSNPFHGDRFLERITAVDGEEEVGNQAGEELHHHAVGASGDAVIHGEVLFPPAEEGFDVPAQLIDGHDLFGGEIEPVRGQLELF